MFKSFINLYYSNINSQQDLNKGGFSEDNGDNINNLLQSHVSGSTNAKLNYKIGGSVANLKKRNSGSIYQTNPTQLMSTTGFDKNNKFGSTVRYNTFYII